MRVVKHFLVIFSCTYVHVMLYVHMHMCIGLQSRIYFLMCIVYIKNAGQMTLWREVERMQKGDIFPPRSYFKCFRKRRLVILNPHVR